MKIIIGLISIILSIGLLVNTINISYAACDTKGSLSTSFKGCMEAANTVVKPDNMTIDDGFKATIYKWVKNIGGMLGLFAVAMIAYGGLMLTISTGDDEKIKKGKDVVKWGMLGFLALVSAGAIITIVINIMFKLGGT